MNADSLAPSLLCAAHGLALAFVRPRVRRVGAAPGLIVMIAAVVASVHVMRQAWIPMAAQQMVVKQATQACWFGGVVCTASVYLPAAVLRRIAPLLAVCTGLCCGIATTGQGDGFGLLRTLPWLLLSWPAAGLIDRGAAVAVKVACSWLLAVAVLAATLAWLPVTPGYLPDHLE